MSHISNTPRNSPEGQNAEETIGSKQSARFPLEAMSTERLIAELRAEPLIKQCHGEHGEYRGRLWFKGRRAGKRAEELSVPLIREAEQAGLIPERPVHDIHPVDLNQARVSIYKVVGLKTYLTHQQCQDAAHVVREPSGRYIVAASSDGAGGVPLSHYGAELMSRISAEVAGGLLEKGLKPETEKFMGRFYREVYEKTHDICRRVGLSPGKAGEVFLGATSILTVIENRGNEVRTSQISISDGAFLSQKGWKLVDKLPDEYPEKIRAVASLGINYPNMIISALAKDFGEAIPNEERVARAGGTEIIERIIQSAQSALLLEQQSGKEVLVGGVGNASDGIAHAIGKDKFPLEALIAADIQPEELRKLALLYSISVTLENVSAPPQKILFAKLEAFRELIEDYGSSPELEDFVKTAKVCLENCLTHLRTGGLTIPKGSEELGEKVEECVKQLRPLLEQQVQADDGQSPVVKLVTALAPFEKVVMTKARELLAASSDLFGAIDYSKAHPILDDIVVVHVQNRMHDLSREALPSFDEQSRGSDRNREISRRVNNFPHFLPGGYQRDSRYEEALLHPERASIPLGEWLDSNGFGRDRKTYSAKRLAQTGFEFIAEIDNVARGLGFNIQQIEEATRNYVKSRGAGDSANYPSTFVEPIFNALLERGYSESDLKT